MTDEARETLRIFISSTAEDLGDYRASARDAALHMEALPVGMETFDAVPDDPVEVCLGSAAGSGQIGSPHPSNVLTL